MGWIKTIIAAVAVLTYSIDMAGQSTPDSIAVCPPGEPAEAMEPQPQAQPNQMSMEEIAVAVDTIRANYDSDWNELSMQGKLQFDGLPMRLSVKVYMKRGESVIMSARAPIFGEVARVEINPDSIVLINKHTRTYYSQSVSGLGVDTKAYLSDLQDIMLGQVAYPGYGRLTADMAIASQWIPMPEDNALIYPSPELQVEDTEYGFVMDSSCWQLRSFVLMLKKSATVIETSYIYGSEGWTLGLEINVPKKKMQGEVQLSYPDYEPTPLDFTSLSGRYRKVGFRELMKF